MELKQTHPPFYKTLNLPFLKIGNMQFFADPPPVDPPAGDPPPADPPASPPNSSNGQGTSLSLETVQAFVNENEDAKKWFQSSADTRVTNAIKTYETNTLPKKIEDAIAERFPAETPAEKALRELQQRFDQSESEKTREKLRNQALSISTEKGLPTKLVDFFIGQDEASTIANLDVLGSVITDAIEKGVEERFKQNSRNPNPPNPPGQPLTREMIAGMSNEEINSRWEEVQKVLNT